MIDTNQTLALALGPFQRKTAIREMARAARSMQAMTVPERVALMRSPGFQWLATTAGANTAELLVIADHIDLDRIHGEVLAGARA